MQLLFGGAFVIDLATITFIIALGIGRPLTWWKRLLSSGLRSFLSAVWPWSVALYALISVALLLITVFGIDNGKLLEMNTPLAGALFVPILLMIFGGVAKGAQKGSASID